MKKNRWIILFREAPYTGLIIFRPAGADCLTKYPKSIKNHNSAKALFFLYSNFMNGLKPHSYSINFPNSMFSVPSVVKS